VEPLYPRLGLLGGASQEGKISKLAALAAARKKKTSEKPSVTEGQPPAQADEQKPAAPRSLSERLAISGSKPSIKSGGLSALSKERRTANLKSPPIVSKHEDKPISKPAVEEKIDQPPERQPEEAADLRAYPSTFAATIVGNGAHPTTPEPGHLLSSSFDVMHIYQQDVTKAFDFAGPSPDDIVFNAQSASKGLPIRGPR
jgi:elongation factor 1 alpha-like protein